jgi:hypothetical protein
MRLAYGASPKGTLLNYFQIGEKRSFDRSPVKQDTTPGTHLPIHAPEKLLRRSLTMYCY